MAEHSNPIQSDTTTSHPIQSNVVIITIFVTLVIAGLSILGYFLWKQLPVTVIEDPTNTYPIQAEGITITSAETRWLDLAAENRFIAGAAYIPEVTLKLGPNSNGHLVCNFEDNNEEPAGDGFSIAINNGKFANGTDTLTLSSTAGYKEDAHYRSYTYSQAPFWKLIVRHSTDTSTPTIIATIHCPPNQ